MTIDKYMKRNVVSIPVTYTIREAAGVLANKHIGLLPVVDQHGKLVGVVSLQTLLSLELPDFISFIADVDFVHDFGAVETTRPPAEVLDKPITTLMSPAISVPANAGLLRTYALLLQHKLHDIPIVAADGTLVGIASRVDIGVAILSNWAKAD